VTAIDGFEQSLREPLKSGKFALAAQALSPMASNVLAWFEAGSSGLPIQFDELKAPKSAASRAADSIVIIVV
jgi:hypothetical protein